MKKTAVKMVALMSGILVVCFAVQLHRGWNGADFAKHALISCASAAFAWRCLSLAKRDRTLSSGNPRLRFALLVALWIAVAIALFVYFKMTGH
jgi:hypothetical protein